MSEIVDVNYAVEDNKLIITPKDGGLFKDNSKYTIKLRGIKTKDEKVEMPEETIDYITAISPMFSSIGDVASIIQIDTLDTSQIYYAIREASKYAKLVYERYHDKEYVTYIRVPYAVANYVKYEAAKECLIKLYTTLMSNDISSGTVGDVTFKLKDNIPNIKNLLDYLDGQIQIWLDALMGYELAGHAEPRSAIRGYKHGGLYPPSAAAERTQTPKSTPISIYRNTRYPYRRGDFK